MPLEQVSEVRSRLVTTKNGNTYRRQYADYRCSYCDKVIEILVFSVKQVKSCGCQRKRLISESQTRHGMEGSATYYSWDNMVQRCTNPRRKEFNSYGGRGITICDQWLNSFEAFLADMGERPIGYSLDRIDNSKGYEPGNCRWADRKIQQRNTRQNRILAIDGISLCVSAWAEQPGASKDATIRSRLRKGWTEREAVFGKEEKSEV